MLADFADLLSDEQYQEFRWESVSGSRYAALLIHGFPGTPAEMRPVAELLHEQFDWTVEGVLLPGFGSEIERLSKYSAKDRISHVKQAYQALKAEYDCVFIVGYSMGGAIATTVAAEMQPDGLILFAPFWKIRHITWAALPLLRFVIPRFKPFKVFEVDFQSDTVRDSIKHYMPIADLDDEATQKAILNFSVPTDIIYQLKLVGEWSYAAAPQIECPVLVIQGRDDMLVAPSLTKAFTKHFPGTVYYKEVAGEHEILKPDHLSWQTIRQTVTAFIQKTITEAEH